MAAAFGHGLRLVDGDLAVEQGRLLEVDGLENLVQALVLRIMTPLGTDVFNTGYGFDVRNAFTQPTGARLTSELIKLNLVRTLSPDPRVREVAAISFPDDAAHLAIHQELDSAAAEARRRGRLWPCEVSLRTVDGATHTLRVNVGI
jgi:phage baseplate assembly protein W